MRQRFWEIDALRGFAVVSMIAFHSLFDLNYFANINLLKEGMWFWLPRIIGGMFIFVAGVSLNLSKSNPLKRGAFIFGLGMAITATTLLLFPQSTIWFGILHFIGLSIILAQPFLKKNALIAAVLAIAFGIALQTMTFNFPWLLWLGLKPPSFQTFDYYPILPWFGVLLLGLEAGKKLYDPATHKRKFKIPELNSFGIKQLCLLGRHSLLIYLLHQPVLISILTFVVRG